MRKNSLSLATAIPLVSVLIGIIAAQSAQQDGEDEEYKVYSSVLKAKHQADSSTLLVIIRSTAPNELILPGSDDQKGILNWLSPLTKEALDDYNLRNRGERDLSDRFDVKAKVVLVNEKEIDDIFREQGVKGWDSFYQAFPDSGGFIEFSRVGFDGKSNQALVFVSHHCGGLCASGTYYLLIKENGEWRIDKEKLIWVS